MALYSREKARRSFFNTVGFRAISQISTMLSYIVLVRALSEQSFGILNLLYAVIPVVSTVASLGLEQTLRRFQPEYLRLGNVAAAAWLLRIVTVARLASTALLLALVLLAWNLVAPLFQLGAYRADFLLFSVLVLFYFQGRILEFAAASHMLHRYSVGSTALLSIVKLLAYLILIRRHELTLRGAILADTIAYGLAYAFLVSIITIPGRSRSPPAISCPLVNASACGAMRCSITSMTRERSSCMCRLTIFSSRH